MWAGVGMRKDGWEGKGRGMRKRKRNEGIHDR